MLKALPGFHAISGCDATVSFLNKGKIRPFAVMGKTKKFLQAISVLSEDGNLQQNTFNDIGDFVCSLYGFPNISSVDEARIRMFEQKYAPKNERDPLTGITVINPSLMPPCQRVLQQNIRRADFVARAWKNAHKAMLSPGNPLDCGWILKNGEYSIK